jgi:hypothetical protein
MTRAAADRSPARLHASVLPGPKPAPFPGFMEPCLPALRGEAPAGVRWVHEIKFDGYRTQAHLRSGRPAIPRSVHRLTIEKREGDEGTRSGSMILPAPSAWSRSARSSCTPGTRMLKD